MLPNRIFFTGVPGSRWSGIAQALESGAGFNTSDRLPSRTYTHHAYTGHLGAYFGWGMEFEPLILWSDHNYIDQAWANPGGCRLVKSHNWPDKFDEIEKCYSDDWIMLVYRPDLTSYSWWHEAGGFQIQYPDYKWYKDSTNMLYEISRSNQQILEYGCKNNVTWEYFTANWVLTNMGQTVTVDRTYPDVLVALIK
jgi:hypothetical protein